MISGLTMQRMPDEFMGIPVQFDILQPQPAISSGVWPFQKIIVGGKWFKLTEPERAAVLAHEVGHCKAWHFERRILSLWAILIPKMRVLAIRWAHQHELSADRFAVRAGHGPALLGVLAKFRGPGGMFYPSFEVRASAIIAEIERSAREAK